MSAIALHLRAMAAVWHHAPIGSTQHREAAQTLSVIVACMFEQSMHAPKWPGTP